MKFLVTGSAGFIGFHAARALLNQGHQVIGLDNLNPYYDVRLKEARLAELMPRDDFSFERTDLSDKTAVDEIFAKQRPQRVINLAAQAGVRHSISNPEDYVQSNIVGFLNVLEGCRRHDVEHLVFASSSSVYGANTKIPFSVHDNADHPVSFYGATKKSNELMAHVYSHLYNLPTTGLRFFTVYGPWGRPDMALFKFVGRILADQPIEVFNEGHHARDFTFIDDVVACVLRIADRVPAPNPNWSSNRPDPATSSAPFRIYNIGRSSPVQLMDFVTCIERVLGRTAKKNFLPMQPGDVPTTYADTTDLAVDVDFKPRTPIEDGVEAFVSWYRDFYEI